MKRTFHTSLIAAAALGLAATTWAQYDAGTTGTSGTSGTTRITGTVGATGTTGAVAAKADAKADVLAGNEREFMQKTAMAGLAEVELARLAQDKAASDAVKQFAQRMAQDHQKANDELKQLAAAKGVSLPTALDKKHAGQKEKLAKLSGVAFDKEYMDHQVDDHSKTVNAFERQARDGKNTDLTAWAAKTLPVLREHLQLARSVEDAAKARKEPKPS